MTTSNQKEQLKGYTQAVDEMSAKIKELQQLQPSIIKDAYKDLENEMRGKVFRLIKQMED